MATALVAAIPLPSPVLHGQAMTMQVVVTNTGTSVAAITSFAANSPNIGFFTIVPQPLPAGGAFLAPGATTTLIAVGTFYCNQNPDLSVPVSPNVQYSINFTVGFSDGSSISSGYITVAPLISEPGAAVFYVPGNPVLLAMGAV